MLSPDGPEGRICNNARGVSSAFACIFEVPHLETPRRSPSEDDTATELTGREFADLCKACFCNVSNVRARKENLYFFRKEKDGVQIERGSSDPEFFSETCRLVALQSVIS